MHKGKRIQIPHLVRHIAGNNADPLIAINDPAIDQMPGAILQGVRIEQTIHDLRWPYNARTCGQHLQIV